MPFNSFVKRSIVSIGKGPLSVKNQSKKERVWLVGNIPYLHQTGIYFFLFSIVIDEIIVYTIATTATTITQ